MHPRLHRTAAAWLAALLGMAAAHAAVTTEEAARLKTELTPFGAEKAGNKDGSIPAWTGGYSTPIPGDKPGGRRGDPFKDDKPLYSVTAKNVDQHAGKLSDGVKALLKKYPESFRLDVYPTRRTAVAPQWVYDNTAKNALRAKLDGHKLVGAYGGTPFPIPKSGLEAIWNHKLSWRGSAWEADFNQYQITANRLAAVRRVMLAQESSESSFPVSELSVINPEDAPDDPVVALAETRRRDMAAGRTLIGPHRADLAAIYAPKGVPADQSSTGEQKALLISLILANARALAADLGRAPVLLLDEVAAHLDADRRAALYDEICALGAQALMTGTEPGLFDSLGDRGQSFAVTDEGGLSLVQP